MGEGRKRRMMMMGEEQEERGGRERRGTCSVFYNIATASCLWAFFSSSLSVFVCLFSLY